MTWDCSTRQYIDAIDLHAEISSSSMSVVAVYVTVPNSAAASKIARSLVEKKLIACANIIPNITSVYQWDGKIHEDSELLLMMKTRRDLVSAIVTEVKSIHPYDLPEVISVDVVNGHQAYLDWVRSSTRVP